MNTNGRGRTLKEPTHSKLDGWRKLVRSESEILERITLNQRTMRGRGVIPTWYNFMLLEYYADMRRYLDTAMITKFRSWWNLVLECGDFDRPPGRAAVAYSWAFLVTEVMRRRKSINRPLDWSKFGLSEKRAGELREYILSNYEGLTMC